MILGLSKTQIKKSEAYLPWVLGQFPLHYLEADIASIDARSWDGKTSAPADQSRVTYLRRPTFGWSIQLSLVYSSTRVFSSNTHSEDISNFRQELQSLKLCNTVRFEHIIKGQAWIPTPRAMTSSCLCFVP